MYIEIPREFYNSPSCKYTAKYKVLDNRNVEVKIRYPETGGDRGYFIFSPSAAVINDSINSILDMNYRQQIKTDIINWLRINKPELFNAEQTQGESNMINFFVNAAYRGIRYNYLAEVVNHDGCYIKVVMRWVGSGFNKTLRDFRRLITIDKNTRTFKVANSYNGEYSSSINYPQYPHVYEMIVDKLKTEYPNLFNVTKTKHSRNKHRSKKNMQYSKNKLGNVVYKNIKPKSYYSVIEKLNNGSIKQSKSSLTGLTSIIKTSLTSGNTASVEISFVDVTGE